MVRGRRAKAKLVPRDAPKRLAVPGLRDILVAAYEIAGSILAYLLTAGGIRQKLAWFGLLFGGAMLIAFRGPMSAIGIALLGLALIIIIALRGAEIARMRETLLLVAEHPDWQEPNLSRGIREHSPTIDSLWTVARCLSLARRGAGASVESTANGVNRSLLGRREARLLDAARALAAWELEDGTRASKLAKVAIPVGVGAIDRELAIIVLIDAWADPDRLALYRGAWLNEAGDLCELAMLIELRHATSEGRGAILETLDAQVVRRLSRDALRVGDRALAEALLTRSATEEPYR